MTLHFSIEELATRRDKALQEMNDRGLDGLLIFRQETMYYLTGYDTFGYVFFQCLVLRSDGKLVLLTRSPDLRQARFTSMIEDIRIWIDRPNANPAHDDLKPILTELGLNGKKLGVEWDAYGLTAKLGQALIEAMDGFCSLEDASMLVTRHRAIKSETELTYVRRAGELGDAALKEAVRMAEPGAHEGDILAAMQGAIFAGGGNYPANEFIISSGPATLLTRYKAGTRNLDDDDILSIEFAGVFNHYHGAQFRTLKVGKRNPRHEEMHKVSCECVENCMESLEPGNPVGDVYEAYAKTVTKLGYGAGVHNACGYSIGATFSPNWMDWPMFYRGNAEIVQPGMTFLLNPGVRDDNTNLFAIVGDTLIVTETGCERLSKASLDYIPKFN
jgi:Xaa-Pro dipeptidase